MYYFIVNPISSSARGLKVWQTIEKELQSRSISYEMYFTRKPGHASSLARKISEDHAPCTIIAVGGDGTINEIICGLTHISQVTLGYIPSGSGNDFARGLGLKTDPLAALNAILQPEVIQKVSIGYNIVNGRKRRFIVSSGIGFDAAVCNEALSSPIKKFMNTLRLGKLTYLSIALKQLIQLKPAPMTILLDGRRHYEFDGIYLAANMNLRYEGGGFMFCPEAVASDEYLDLCVVEKMPKLKLLTLLPTCFSGKHINYKGIHLYRFKTAEFHSAVPLQIHADGEKAGVSGNITVALESERLSIIIA